MTRNGTLPPRQRRALQALLVAPSFSAAAQAAGIGRRTLYAYLADPNFQAALAQANSTAMRLVVARMVGLLQKSLDIIERALESGDDKVALSAAQAVLRHTVGLLEFADLSERVAALENKIKSGGEK